MYQVRDGKRVVPTCPECGCRLDIRIDVIYHFGHADRTGVDKRGHKCSLIETMWNEDMTRTASSWSTYNPFFLPQNS